MAYNLESLVKLLHEIAHNNHPLSWILDPCQKPQIESLLEKVCFLKEHFENFSPRTSDEVQSLECQIRDATYDAEDVIESHIAHQLLTRVEGQELLICPPDLTVVIGKFDLVESEMKTMDRTLEGAAVSSSMPVSSRQDVNPKNIIVGMSEDLIHLKDRLTGGEPKREIIPIVGTGGIGKTTLAKNLYEDPLVVSHFDICAWATISQSHDVKSILLQLLHCISRESMDGEIQRDTYKLGLHLHKALCGERYLIVLDDIWDCNAWDAIQMFIPVDNNGSRILVTSRELSVANYIGSESTHHHMNFLNEVESWDLLRRKVFGEETCPPQLEEIGKTIGADCRGLPLAILVVGGVLSKLDTDQESWVQVAKGVHSAVSYKDEFSDILSLSYICLPNHLKPCFLYLSIYPEDCIFRASQLIRLWVAEGFLKPILDKSLEEAAEVYLKELTDRNLMLAYQQEVKGNVKRYIMHDLVRELCIRKAKEENFLLVATNVIQESCLKDKICSRRLSAHIHYSHIIPTIKSAESARAMRSVLYFGPLVVASSFRKLKSRCLELYELQLLRVLDILNVIYDLLPQEVERLVNLRYLAIRSWYSNAPYWISRFCNLQTFVFFQSRKSVPLFRDIQELINMGQVRHIKFKGEYPLYVLRDGESVAVQENLQTLSTIAIDDSFAKILQAIPNLKKLGIFESDFPYRISCMIDLRCLSKLEILKCSTDSIWSGSFLSHLIFPASLKKLTIFKCGVPYGYLYEIGSLPNLEVLKLLDSSLFVREWEPTEREFQKLRYLLLAKLNLAKWIADETNYPKLECLVIQDCSQLEEIPSGIGGIATLEVIEVHGACSTSALDSARKIQDEKIGLGE